MLLLTAGLPEFAAVPRMPQAPHDTGPGLHGQDTAHRSPKQDLLLILSLMENPQPCRVIWSNPKLTVPFLFFFSNRQISKIQHWLSNYFYLQAI